MNHVYLTGATGAVGSELLPRLLRDGYTVHCIIRTGPRGESAHERLGRVVRHPRATAVSGDIMQLGCGVDLGGLPQADKFIHAAADVRFDPKHAAEIQATNVGGTRNVLELAHVLQAKELHYVGTTYIAGDAAELTEPPVGHSLAVGTARNAYERSKYYAERLVHDAFGRRASIYRPSIVIGRSTDGSTATFDGYYGFFKGLWRLAQRLRDAEDASSADSQIRIHTDGTVHLPVVIRAIESTKLNLIPSDWLADILAKLITLPARGESYNLAHLAPMTVGEVIRVSLEVLGITGVRVQEESAVRTGDRQLDTIQKMVDAGLARYQPYVTHSPVFSCVNAARDLSGEFVPLPAITASFLQKTIAYAVAVWETEVRHSSRGVGRSTRLQGAVA